MIVAVTNPMSWLLFYHATGTQRLPRLVGLSKAIEMMLVCFSISTSLPVVVTLRRLQNRNLRHMTE